MLTRITHKAMNFKTSTLVILALGSLLIGSAHADITSGLVTYLNLNETNGLTAADSSGNGINGTLVNFPADNSEWTTNGRIAGALVGNTTSPTTEYISLPNTANLNFDTGLAFTLSAWVKGSIAGASQVSGAAIFCKGIGGTGEQFTVDLNSGKFRFYVRNSGGTVSQATSTLAPAAGTWYHIVAVFNASGTNRVMQFYVNGQLNFSLTPPTSLKANTHVVSIGNREGGAATGYNLPFKGTIDDVHIYNRALSASDIYELYASNGRAPIITTQPRNVSCYLNDTPVLAVGVDQANSIVPVSYQWQLNGTNLPGATAANLVLTNVQSAAAGTYSVSVSNVIGITVSSNAVLQVASLPAADITNSLVGYWTFDDAAGSTTAADSTANANTASLVNFTDPFACWTNGLIAGGLNFNGDATALNYVSIPDSAPLSFTNSLAFTLAAWVNGPVLQTNTASIIAKGTGNGGEQFTVDISGGRYRFYVRNATGTVFTATTSVGPNNTWQHLVAVVNATNGLMNFYVNGQLAGASAAPFSLLANTHEISVGSRQSASAAYNLPFTGTIDDVRLYNRDLTSADVQALYLTGGVFPPAFVSQPHGTSLYAGDNLKLSGLANGTVPLVYQWIKNGTNIIGATNTSLIFAPLQLGDAGDYTLAVTNAYGAITSSVAVVQVQAFDLTNALAGFWKFDDGSGSATAADASANGNTATLINFPDATSEWVTGRINGAVNFNSGAVNQYATIADSPSLNFQSNLAFTIAAWVRGPATQISGAGVLAKGV
ncbi:MAG: Immunoglobulin I-set domain protein, partial [Pedosphaera sp.]|nr:Immunoglobulin I-set domain protein [Pedosphaera sp.]